MFILQIWPPLSILWHELQIFSWQESQSNYIDSKSPARGFGCCVWCFSCGSPSREVLLRNVATPSRLAEPSPNQPCLPPLILTSLPFPSSSLCAAEHHSRFLCHPPEGYWVMCHGRGGGETPTWYIFNLNWKCKRKACLFLSVFMHEKKIKEGIKRACDRKNSQDYR